MSLPSRLTSLYMGEEFLRTKAQAFIAQDTRLTLHIAIVERAMDLCDLVRQVPIEDEDFKVVQILAMRMFNAFGASLKLALAGYSQNSALVMRDILETVFLVDLFRGDRSKITQWRLADRKTLKQHFSLVAVQEALDSRDGNTEKRRHDVYKLFSELAGHPSMKSAWMMRPEKDGDAVIGPFMEKTSLEAVLSEMGRLAVQAGQHLREFFPKDWKPAFEARLRFAETQKEWRAAFFPAPGPNTDNK